MIILVTSNNNYTTTTTNNNTTNNNDNNNNNNDNYNNKTQLIRIGNASREKPCVTTTQNRHESTDYPRYCPNP